MATFLWTVGGIIRVVCLGLVVLAVAVSAIASWLRGAP